jgi:transposase InsO family protein
LPGRGSKNGKLRNRRSGWRRVWWRPSSAPGEKACRFLRLSRATYWYRSQPPSPRMEQLRERMEVLSGKHPRYGYRRIAALLRREGWRVGKRQIQRLRRQQGLRVPPTRRKLVRRGISTGLPTQATHRGHVWTVGLYFRCHNTRRSTKNADDPGRIHARVPRVAGRSGATGPPTCSNG